MALIDGLISYYKFDENSGTIAKDSHGTNDGTANNTRVFTTQANGIINTGADFTGGDDYIDLTNTTNLYFDDEYTISLWVKPNSFGTGVYTGKSTSTSNHRNWLIQETASGQVFVYAARTGGTNYGTSSFALLTGNWYNLVLVTKYGSGGYSKLYINGALDINFTNNNPIYSISNHKASIGSEYNANTGSFNRNYADSIIDEVGIWNRGLTSGEITTLYNGGAGLAYPFGVAPPPITEKFLDITGVTTPTSAHEGDLINFTIHTQNIGATNDFKIEVVGIEGEIFEGFENGFVEWKNVVGDDFDWTRKSGSTSSSLTGPSGAYEGSYYAYTESSSPNYPNKTTYLESSEINSISGLNFNYHMYGSAMGVLSLEISEYPYSTWTQIWNMSGNQGNAWYLANIDLSAYSEQTVKLRFKGYTGTSYTSDMAVDNISIFAISSSEFHLETGLTKDIPFLFIMPNTDASITINSFHWTPAGWVWDTSSVWDVNTWQ